MPMHGGIDLYAVLGLNPSADDVVIHAAWKALLRKHHPDTNPGDPSGARAREINEAFAVLGKPDSRARYDRLRIRGPEIVALRGAPPLRFRPPPRRRLSPTRVFGTAMLIAAAVPFAMTALLAFPPTGRATRGALLSVSSSSPFAYDLISRLDAVARGFVVEPAPPGAATNDDDGEIAAND
jgi:curved DNA-binding protein CbpA